MDDLDYLPDDAWPAEDDPYRRYADAGWAQPEGRHRAAGQWDYVPARMNGTPAGRPADGRQAPGYPPANGRPAPGYPPATSGPMPTYPPANPPTRGYPPRNGRPAPGYPLSTSGPMPAYSPDSGPMPAYQPRNGRPALGYPLLTSGPMPTYPPDTGPIPASRPRNGRPPGYPPATSGPMPTYPPANRPTRGYPPPNGRPALRHPPASGKLIAGWLPFGNRLVLLPKDLPFNDGDEALREHRDVNGGWLRPAVFGAMDGLVTNASLIAGIGAGGGGRGMIVLTGIAGLIAGAFSMATGEYISVRSQNELTQAEVELERKQHRRDPDGKLRRLTDVFIEKGVSPNLAEAVVRQISADPDRAVATHVREELGIDPDDLPSPQTAAIASFASFTVGALLPLGPFLVGFPNLTVALTLAGMSAFIGGAAVARLTGRPMLLGGLRQFTAAFLGTGAAFLMGHLIGGHVG